MIKAIMTGVNESQRSDCMELPKDLDDEGERHVIRQVETVTAFRFVHACHATESLQQNFKV